MKTALTLIIPLMICLRCCAQPSNKLNQNIYKIDIVITHVPKYNSPGYVEGQIIGDVNLRESRIAGYLFSEEGGGYFNKPYWASPTVGISSDSTFRVNVTTGGMDEKAMTYLFFLVPATYEPPILRGGKIPEELFRKFPFTKITRESK
jgi:hypothetical protein